MKKRMALVFCLVICCFVATGHAFVQEEGVRDLNFFERMMLSALNEKIEMYAIGTATDITMAYTFKGEEDLAMAFRPVVVSSFPFLERFSLLKMRSVANCSVHNQEEQWFCSGQTGPALFLSEPDANLSSLAYGLLALSVGTSTEEDFRVGMHFDVMGMLLPFLPPVHMSMDYDWSSKDALHYGDFRFGLNFRFAEFGMVALRDRWSDGTGFYFAVHPTPGLDFSIALLDDLYFPELSDGEDRFEYDETHPDRFLRFSVQAAF